jgi:hypothetical protein
VIERKKTSICVCTLSAGMVDQVYQPLMMRALDDENEYADIWMDGPTAEPLHRILFQKKMMYFLCSHEIRKWWN